MKDLDIHAPNLRNYSFVNNSSHRQAIAQENFYTSCGIDMMDDFGQRFEHDWRFPSHPAVNYAINPLDQALRKVTTSNH